MNWRSSSISWRKRWKLSTIDDEAVDGKILQHFYGRLNDVMDYLEEVDPDVEQVGLSRRKVMADLAHYEQLLYDEKREATQATPDAFFLRFLPATSLIPVKSLTLATSLLPATSLSPARQQEALPTLILRHSRRQMLTTQASSNSPPPPQLPTLQPQQARTSGHFW